ncbi:O-antigen ligase family protein [Hymenobacter properus]|uniref:O-antigen ligase family protein n=1 Tax=Hymenobacter properus TaxID=2791026 RepID=A0A931BLL3_9BACT|nr:O-antigen ligase family protein [Hymenobacter properus]MBF9141700.1 O-antigen ligase family protein [Hymenobacter properus]MBR7720509.1 O-antigen ligase family protein [Microvirga sp. SRT04]
MTPSLFRSRLLWLFYVALASVPLSVSWFSERWRFGLLLASEPLMALTVGALGLGLVAGWLPWPRTARRLDKLIGLHVGALFVSTVFSSDVVVSAKYFATIVLYISFGYGVQRVLRLERTEWFRALWALALGTGLLAAFALMRHAQIGISYTFSYFVARPFLEHGHTNLTVILEPLVLVLNMALLYHPRAQRQRGRFLITMLLTAVLMVVAFSYSRASYVSMLAQALLLLAFSGREAGVRLLLPWAVASCLVLGGWQVVNIVHPHPPTAAKTNLLQELGSVSDFSSANESNAERMSRWLFSFDLFQQEPVVGVGPGTFPDRYLEFVRKAPAHPNYYTTLRRMNAHDLYLDWLAESGALGLLSGLLLLGYLLVRQLKWVFHGPQTPAQVGITAYLLYFLLHSFAQDFWQEPRVVVLFWLAVGLQRYYARAAMHSAPTTPPVALAAPASEPTA